jgi:hypothetical protein
MSPSAISITYDPMIPWVVLAGAVAAGLMLVVWCLWRRAGGTGWRAGTLVVLSAALANPTLVSEQREPRPDVVVIAIDESPSQNIGERAATRDAALLHVQGALERMRDLEIRTVRVHGARFSGQSGQNKQGTRLFETISRAVGDIPRRRLAGVIAITDGQIHDAVTAGKRGDLPAPFHVILTGDRGESDRLLHVERAPSFGMVGRDVTMSIRVVDSEIADGTAIPVTMGIDGKYAIQLAVPANRSHEVKIPLGHAGETIVELVVEARAGELGLINNRMVHAINGVRDRLRVLLVSGAPHAGERTWRNLLKADPSVDLVHFTILRPPEKQDGTPIRELSLIAFPVRELFELKLDEFDLIIFDRYRRRGVLSRSYLSNIVEYVRKGGAFLEASGPSFATRLSLANSPLRDVLPAIPTGQIIERGFTPRITDKGFRHPVTAGLARGGRLDEAGKRIEEATWGRWLRQIVAEPKRGIVLIDGVEEKPLLILDRVGEGRVAHLLSDHIWLWSRGFEGGGPQAEMLRRTAHWLMKEPDLEEDDLRAVAQGARIAVTRRSLETALAPITMTRPDGLTETITLSADGPGVGSAFFETSQIGLHSFTDGNLVRLAAIGALNPVEFSDLRSTDRLLAPIVDATGGGLHWAAADGLPDLRRVRAGRATAGRDWIGLTVNEDYVVTGVNLTALMPNLLALALILGSATIAWRREGA